MEQQKQPRDYGNIIFVGVVHIVVLIFLPLYLFYRMPSSLIIWSMFILWIVGGIGITALYHRYYSHKAYKMKKITEAIFLFFVSFAVQGSPISWVHDHRNHHAFEDRVGDPYNIKKGFMHAHMWWMFRQRPFKKAIVADLFANSLVRKYHENYGLIVLVINLLTVLCIGYLAGDFIGAIIFSLFLRLFFVQHCTWFINSLAHTMGSKKYKKGTTAVDNFVVAFLTFGEGYHNFHHAHPVDYRNGLRWYDYDPAKWIIFLLSKVGLTWDLKRTPSSRLPSP